MANLNKITDEISQCTLCPLHENRTNAVPGEGNPRADLLFIGEGPGKKEDELGRPFVGPAGKLLEELLATIGLKREDVFIANVVKCRPPGNRDPLPEEVEACWPYLQQQVNAVDPKLIILLGRHSLDRFLPNMKISQARGKPMRREVENLGRYVFYPIYHPAAALHNPNNRQPLIDDFQKIPAVLAEVDKLPEKDAADVEIEDDIAEPQEKQARLEL
ncbi:uracil-DNA glycosylase [Patescibacteria group bacterium]|nr:uracil-DNA glycosylase [Patescibacteria group bacterium]